MASLGQATQAFHDPPGRDEPRDVCGQVFRNLQGVFQPFGSF